MDRDTPRPDRLRQMERHALATLVASVETQLTAEIADRIAPKTARPTREHAFAALLVTGLTLFAVAVDGYHPDAEDGGLYTAGIKRLLNPALYPHGADFVLEPTRLSLFAPAIAAMVRAGHAGLPVVLLAVHLASIWLTLFAAWMLAGRCWTARVAQAGAVLLPGVLADAAGGGNGAVASGSLCHRAQLLHARNGTGLGGRAGHDGAKAK